jgi:hypothetical protein
MAARNRPSGDKRPSGRPAQGGTPAEETRPTLKFPHRDENGRVDTLLDLLVGVVMWLLAALVLLLVVELIAWALGSGFGETSGWLAGALAVLMFAEEYRAWRPVPGRAPLALLGVLVGGTMGVATTGLINALPHLVSGFVGVAVATLAYAILWYFGVRWLARRSGER